MTTTGIDRPLATRENLLWYLVLGCLFDVVLMKTENRVLVRVCEDISLRSFHMCGVLGSMIASPQLRGGAEARRRVVADRRKPICQLEGTEA
jgi:hypothetical protein